ncbi:MAG: hypothetical protein Q9214_000653 [Letrouitia sp. 1 TL-2023]
MSAFSSSPLSGRSIRPSSEVYYNQNQQSHGQNNPEDVLDRAAQQWIADIDQYETTLEEMAAATLDQDFKDELAAIEQWFKVLSEAERTAALYALLQQTTQVQIRFFIQVLQQMAKNAMSNRLSDAMSKISVEGSRNSLGRPPVSPGNKRNSGLDPSTINAMFPDAAAAIAKKKAEYTQQTGNAPTSNRNSAAIADRSSLAAPTISGPAETIKENVAQPSPTPWGQRPNESRPKSSSGQQPIGPFSQSSSTAGLRSPRLLQTSGNSNVQSTSINALENNTDPTILSPYNLGNASWASMSNTPMVANFSNQQTSSQADMVANATAMKLAALSTVNNRIALDDVRKYRRTRSSEGDETVSQMPLSPGMPGTNVLVVNESGQLVNSQPLSAQQLAALQAQQQATYSVHRSRPSSPRSAMQGGNFTGIGFAPPQNNGYLSAYDGSSGINNGMGTVSLGQFGLGHSSSHEGYLSDHSEVARGRSPRARRGTSKPPEDPTDPALLQDIPAWLRSLRLHKYTDCLKDLKWTDLIELDDKGLEERGVNALGARRKMLKVAMNEYPDPNAFGISPWVEDYSNSGDLDDDEPFSTLTLAEPTHNTSAESPLETCNEADETDEYLSEDSAVPSERADEDTLFNSRVQDLEPSSLAAETAEFGDAIGQSERGGGRYKGVKRGHRKPIEPTGEFKAIRAQALSAYLSLDKDRAEQLALQAIRNNPEIYSSYNLLFTIYNQKGEQNKALTALFNGAHTRPHDIELWTRLAELFLERTGERTNSDLTDALYCYSRVIQADSENIHARHRRAELNRELGYLGRAVLEYEHLLKLCPHDKDILQQLATLCVLTDSVDRALGHYKESIANYQSAEPLNVTSFTWSDVNVTIELYGLQLRYDDGISQLKYLSRWLCGRQFDTFWDSYTEDDREWDIDDEPRRLQVPEFRPEKHPPTAYGHFEMLGPDLPVSDSNVFRYPDLFRDVADALREEGFFREALRFYEPLQRVQDYPDTEYYRHLTLCYQATGFGAEAEACLKAIAASDNSSMDALSPIDQVVPDLDTLSVLDSSSETSTPDPFNRLDRPSPSDMNLEHLETTAHPAMLLSRKTRPKTKNTPSERRFREQCRKRKAQALYDQIRELTDKARNGDLKAKRQWMRAAQELTDDFRSKKRHFTPDRRVSGYHSIEKSNLASLRREVDPPMQGEVGRSRQSSSWQTETEDSASSGEYHGIPFSSWLDVFLEYAMFLAKSGKSKSAYEILGVASHAHVFSQSTAFMSLIHLCWTACAIANNDDETCCTVVRWFMKEYRLSTDSILLFSAANRLCDTDNAVYNSGRTQKFVLRQLKAMDDSRMSWEPSDATPEGSRTNPNITIEESGPTSQAQGTNIVLLMLYGHILHMGKSYASALSKAPLPLSKPQLRIHEDLNRETDYFFRAFALNRKHPMIHFSIGICYLQQAIKRQANNRHHLLALGFSFLFEYYKIRRASSIPAERQEAEYNVGRAYHLLGLPHLAAPYYGRCLALDAQIPPGGESFSTATALALQGIWAATGNMTQEALQLTGQWLVM